jgi:hypothetical protein
MIVKGSLIKGKACIEDYKLTLEEIKEDPYF